MSRRKSVADMRRWLAIKKVHRFPAEGIQAQALENALHRFQAAFHMALVGHAFADVVKQQAKDRAIPDAPAW